MKNEYSKIFRIDNVLFIALYNQRGILKEIYSTIKDEKITLDYNIFKVDKEPWRNVKSSTLPGEVELLDYTASNVFKDKELFNRWKYNKMEGFSL